MTLSHRTGQRVKVPLPAGEDRPVPAKAEGLVEYPLDGELVLYDPEHHRVSALNATAAAVWLLCDGARNLAQVAADMAGLFGVEAAAVAEDVRSNIARLRRAGLLRGGDVRQ